MFVKDKGPVDTCANGVSNLEPKKRLERAWQTMNLTVFAIIGFFYHTYSR